MKNFTLPLLMAAGLFTLQSFAPKPGNKQQPLIPLTPAQQTAPSKAAVSPTVIVDEDFSGLKSGSETQLGNVVELNAMGDVVNSSLFKPYNETCTRIWGGYELYEAGGAIALKGGFLCTPQGNYSGELTVTCRVKKMPGTVTKNNTMDILLYQNKSLVDCKRETYVLSDQWQDITFTANNGPHTDGLIQFFTPSDMVFLVDDLKITNILSDIEAPKALDPLTPADDVFVANWEPTPTAEEYLLSVFHKAPNPEVVSDKQSFETVNLVENGTKIDAANPGYPSGWNIDLAKNGTIRQAFTEPEFVRSGKQSLCIDATNDIIETPVSKYPIKELRYWLKADGSKLAPDANLSGSIDVYVLTDFGWQFWEYTFLSDILNAKGGMVIDLTSKLSTYTNVYQVRFTMDSMVEVPVAIDDIEYVAPGTPVDKFVLENHVVPGRETASYEVKGLNPEETYFYYVKARAGAMVSKASETIEVFDVHNPIAEPATNVSPVGYTANWTCGSKADFFHVNQWLSYTAKADTPDYMLVDEDFSRVTSTATPENPELGEYRGEYLPIDEYTKVPGWTVTSFALANGMIGGVNLDNAPMDALAGALSTPTLDLSNNNGMFKMKLRVYGQAGDFIIIAGLNQFTTIGNIEIVNTGWVEAELEMFSNRTNEVLTIYSNNYLPFMVDYVQISQSLKANDEVSISTGRTVAMDKDARSIEMANPYFAPGHKTYYSVTAFRYFHGMTEMDPWQSPESARIEVVNPGAVETVAQDGTTVRGGDNEIVATLAEDGLVEVYSIDGQLQSKVDCKAGDNVITVNGGLYLVRLNGKTTKVIVR